MDTGFETNMFRNHLIWRHVMEASIWWHYQVFFQNLTFGDRVFQNHRRSDLAKPRQTDTARSCLHWNNQWCCKQFSEQHCLEPFFLKAIMRVCFLCHHLDIWRWGVVEPLEGVTLPSRIRQTPNQVSRSDLLFNHQWFWKPFSNQQWLDIFGKHFIRHCVWCHHQRIFQVWQLATGLQKPMGRSDRAKLLQSGSSPSCQGSRRSARTTRISEVCTSKLFDGNFNPWGLKEKLPVPF